MADKKPVALVALIIAGLSLGLNLWQYLENRSISQTERSSLTTFYALADDNTLLALYGSGIDAPGKRTSLGPVLDSKVGEEMKEYAATLGARKEGKLRRYPIASFVVVHNAGSRDIHDLRMTESPLERPMLSPGAFVLADEWLVVPLDFRKPGEDYTEPSLPAVKIHYDSKEQFLETTGPRTLWLNNQFIRAMIEER